MAPPALAVRNIYVACLLVATANHLTAFVQHGLNLSPSGIFWASLTVIDPAIAALLFFRPRTGTITLFALMGLDIGHNFWFLFSYAPLPQRVEALSTNPFLACQIAFLFFVLTTADLLTRRESEGGSGTGQNLHGGA